MKTCICDILGIEYPVIQGGMAWVADWSLASAVSNAGGLGLIGAGNAPADFVRDQIRRVKSAAPGKVFGVNIMLLSPFSADIARIVVEEEVPVVTTGAGSSIQYMDEWLSAGIKVVPVVASTAMAKRAQRAGACAVVAEGCEAGGHIGELTTMAMIPQVADCVDIPVIAAGGIADGRGLAAALMLGAKGVQIGTRFLVAKECTVHENYKKKVLKAGDISTMTTGKSLGSPVRALKTPFTRAFQKNEADPGVTKEQLEAFGVGAVRKAVQDGDEQGGSFLAGQIAGLVNREQSCKEIITEIFAQAEELLKGAAKWVN